MRGVYAHRAWRNQGTVVVFEETVDANIFFVKSPRHADIPGGEDNIHPIALAMQ